MSKELLTQFGITEEVNTENLEAISNKLVDAVKAKLFEDENFFTTIPKEKLPKDWFSDQFNQGVSKVAGMGKSAIDKHFGLSNEDKATFTEEDAKDISKYIAKATEIFKARQQTPPDVAKLQDENIQLKQALEGKSAEIESLKEKFESDFNEKLTAKELETLALIESSVLQENIPIKVNLIFDKAFSAIKSKYAVIIENGSASIRKKDNTAFKIEKADKSGHMTLKDALEVEFKEMGAWKQADNGGKVNNGRVIIEPGKNINQKLIDKIKQEEEFLAMR